LDSVNIEEFLETESVRTVVVDYLESQDGGFIDSQGIGCELPDLPFNEDQYLDILNRIIAAAKALDR